MTTDQIITLVTGLGIGGGLAKIVALVQAQRKQRRDEDVSITLSERDELREIHRAREEELKEVRRLRDMTIEEHRALELKHIKLEFECREKDKQMEAQKLEITELKTQIEILKGLKEQD